MDDMGELASQLDMINAEHQGCVGWDASAKIKAVADALRSEERRARCQALIKNAHMEAEKARVASENTRMMFENLSSMNTHADGSDDEDVEGSMVKEVPGT